jgi:hypothetical protein
MKGLISFYTVIIVLFKIISVLVILYFAFYFFKNPELFGNWIHRFILAIKGV